jgi:hypothetical protein
VKDSLKASTINSCETVACSIITELEALLLLCGAIDPPLHGPLGEQRSHSNGDSEEDDDDDDSFRMRSAAASTNARAPKNIRGQKKDDSDSEFEFDM